MAADDRKANRTAKRQSDSVHARTERAVKGIETSQRKRSFAPRSIGGDFKRVPVRKVTGPMNVYYYDYVAERANGDLRAMERIGSMPGRGDLALRDTEPG